MFYEFWKVNILEHIIQRCKHYGITPIVCTSNLKSDKKIIDIAKKIIFVILEALHKIKL